MPTVFSIPFFFRAPVFLVVLFFITTFCWSSLSMAGIPRYHLDISFQPEQKQMQAKATILYPAGHQWRLYTHGLNIHEILVQEEGKEAFSLPLPDGDTIQMHAGRKSQQVIISYTLQIPQNSADNLISPRGIALTSGWHPMPSQDMYFSLSAALPPGFQGIAESDTLPEQQEDNKLITSFSQAVRTIHLAAGPYQVEQEEIRAGLTLSTWFFPEDQLLSQDYLDAARAYLLRYEKEIGPFPYKHYAIVSNRLPTGFGMPTFTLLGQMVLRLPFIKETSLGHEILHSWFGNSIGIAEDSGNWCEGLTSYLADFSYAADKGEGAAHRKAGLVNYQSYVQPDSVIALQNFRSASHQQAMAKAVRAVGYNRGAMFFHQLRGLLGPEHFFQGLRFFAASHQGKAASWRDIQQAFETASGKELETFFSQQLVKIDMPGLTVKDIHSESSQDSSVLEFTLDQTSDQPYFLRVPIRVTTATGEKEFIREIRDRTTKISLSLATPPLSFALDPNYDLFRRLTAAELPPTWSSFLGAQNKLLLLEAKETAAAFTPFIQWAEQQGWSIADAETITNQQLSEHSILFLGAGGTLYRTLLGNPPSPGEGFRLSVRNNPLNAKNVVVLLTSSSAEEAGKVLRKLSHYGKYSSLFFLQGILQEKEIATTDTGIVHVLETLPAGGPTTTVDSFDQVVTELSKNRVIYLGETHDSLADHLLQLRIIQTLQKKGVDLAIAMEMFPQSSQKALDKYVLEQTDMDEAAFLRASRWFDVWRHDWRLFRPIFNFCRNQKIPIYGINVDREIVKNVFASGNTDGLSEEQQEDIAKNRDLTLDGYIERLSLVHTVHNDNPHGKGKGLAGFVQSQAIWDETMAKNIVSILEDNPEKTVLVIAGAQHTRKDSGIPPRVLRRLPVKQASVLNLYIANPPANLDQQVDFFFLAKPRLLKPKGKIGVMLKPEEDKENPRLRISGISATGKAGQAGLKENDIILAVEGQAVKNMEDVGIVMMNSRAGDKVKLTILRSKEGSDPEEKEFTVELSDPSRMSPHP